MKKFKQMSKSDRIKMEALLNAGLSKAAVAEQLHFHRSTIYREYDKGKYMHRNSDYTEEERYSSDLGQKAHDYAQEGKGRSLKIGNCLTGTPLFKDFFARFAAFLYSMYGQRTVAILTLAFNSSLHLFSFAVISIIQLFVSVSTAFANVIIRSIKL